MNELNYLIKLGEQNISQAKLSLQILFGLTTVITFAFKRKLTEESYNKIKKLEQDFISITSQGEETKNTIRDISLKKRLKLVMMKLLI